MVFSNNWDRVLRRAGCLLMVLLPWGKTSAAQDLSEIRARGALRVLVVPLEDSPFFSTGAQLGFDRELVEGFSNLQRLKLEVVPVKSWDSLIPALQAGKGDLIAGNYTDTEQRRKTIDFTQEVFPTRNVVVSFQPHKPPQDMSEFRGEKIGIVKGTSMADALRTAGITGAAVDDSIPPGGLLAALKRGTVSCGVMGIEEAILAQRAEPNLVLGMFVGPPGRFAYGVRKGSPELLGTLNTYIDNVRHGQTWSRLVVKYFGANAPEILKKTRGD